MNDLMKKKIENGREYRKMTMEVRSVDNDADKYYVEGYATTFDEPYHLYYYDNEGHEVKEQVSRNAFDNTDMSDVIMKVECLQG